MPIRVPSPPLSLYSATHVVNSRAASRSDITSTGSLLPANRKASSGVSSSTRTQSQLQRAHVLVVYLPTFWFRAAWVTILTFQVAVALTIFHYSNLFRYFASEGMTYYVNLLDLLPPNALNRVADYMLVLSGWHVLMAARTVWASIWSRRLAFTYSNTTSPVVIPADGSLAAPTRLTARCEQRILSMYRWVWYELLGRRGIFGVESPLFDVLFVLRELVEIGSQTYQTYHLTHLVASPWITNISTLLVICNCVSTPIVQHFCRGKPAIERALCLTIDALLDVSTSLVIPFVIFWPYYKAFIVEIIGFADELLFDDVWQIRALMENKQIYMTSEIDCISKLVPLVSMISSFNGIRKLIQEKPASVIKPVASGNFSVRKLFKGASAANAATRRSTEPERRKSALASFWSERVGTFVTVKAKSRVNRLVHALLLLWAILVGVIHLVAIKVSYGTGEEFGCKLSTRPWFSTRFSCAVLEINCNRQELSGGAAAELGTIMETLEGGSLSSLIISHCPRLWMPPQLQQFSSLLSMEVYNSTIVAWPKNAAICQQHHPAIGLLTLVRCNMSELPEGVLVDLPRALTDITIVASNLTSLPHNLDTRWPGVSSLLVEQGQFTELPPVVGRMPSLIRLSFVGNEIVAIADDAFTHNMQLFVLALSGNPIASLPANIGSVANFKTLYLDHTNVGQLPQWVLTEAFLEAVLWVAMDQSPYCGKKAESITTTTAAMSTSARVQELLPLKVRCTPEKNRVGGFFPLTQAARKRVP